MAFVRLAWFPGAREQHFRDLAAALSHVSVPDGRLAFAAGPVDGGWQVVQIWTDQEALDDFNASFFGPALASLGSTGFPQPPVVVDFETVIFDSR